MIITRTPFRISFCGGGSDLRSFYEHEEGCVISTTIDKYMYISLHPYFEPGQISLKYSQTELVEGIDQIKHRIFREALKQFGITGVEITSTADIPAGTGLGSSSSFTVGLLHALNLYVGNQISKRELAENACEIEIERLGSPIGKQDQFAASFGGLNYIRFLTNGETIVEPIHTSNFFLSELEDRLVLLYTGRLHQANAILHEQRQNTEKATKRRNISQMCELAKEMRRILMDQKLDRFGELLHENWLLKRTLASGISDSYYDEIYQTALRNGASGGKLLGAGGGGFFLFFCEPERRQKLIKSLRLREIPFHFEYEGTSRILPV